MSTMLTQTVSARDHAEGPADAPLTLVEYGDYQCPYCGAAYPVVKRLQKTLGKKLRLVFRNFPLTQSHPYALIAAETAEAAALSCIQTSDYTLLDHGTLVLRKRTEYVEQ